MKLQTLDEISRYLALDKDSLLEKGVETLLKEKKRRVKLDSLGIISRYEVSSAEELERKIQEGKLAEHPAWEDLIVLENLESTLEKIDEHLRNLSAAA